MPQSTASDENSKRGKNEELLTAVYKEDLQRVMRAMGEGAFVDATCVRYGHYHTALQVAVSEGLEDIAFLLINRGARVDLCNWKGEQTAHLAAKMGHLNILKALVKKHPRCIKSKVFQETQIDLEEREIDLCDKEDTENLYHHRLRFARSRLPCEDGNTPLHFTCSGRQTECLEYLLEQDTNKELKDQRNSDNMTPLHIAVYGGWLEGVRILLRANADVMAVDKAYNTVLHLATGNPEILEVLLKAPRIPTVKDNKNDYGLTALNVAVKNGCLESVNMLLQDGADTTSVDKEGNTVLHLAADNRGVLEVLLKYPGITEMMESENNIGETPLFVATKAGNYQSASHLRGHGARLDVINNERWNMAHAASLGGLRNILECLLNDVRTRELLKKRTIEGLTPMHLAVYGVHKECVDFLLEKCCTPNITSDFEWQDVEGDSSPVHIAVRKGQHSIVDKLCKHGYAPSPINQESMTPLLLAINRSDTDSMRTLLVNGANLSDRMPKEVEHYGGLLALEIILKFFPKPEVILLDALDSYMSVERLPTETKMSFKHLMPYSDDNNFNQFMMMQLIFNCERENVKEKIVQHPVIQSFLYVGSKKLESMFYVLMCIHLLCTVMFTVMVSQAQTHDVKETQDQYWNVFLFIFCTWINALTLKDCLMLNCEIHWSEAISFEVVFNLFTAVVCLLSLLSDGNNNWASQLPPIALICLWFQLIFFMTFWKTPGVYLLMFLTVMKKMLKVLAVFSCMILGFASSFNTILQGNPSMENMWNATTKILIMSEDLSHNDFAKSYEDNYVGRVFFLLFVLVVTLALTNLFIGIAVSDVEDLKKHGHAQWLLNQARFLRGLEFCLRRISKAICLCKTNPDDLGMRKLPQSCNVYFEGKTQKKNILSRKLTLLVFDYIIESKSYTKSLGSS